MPNQQGIRERDSQRSRVYSSENAAFRNQLLDFEEIQAMLSIILSSTYWKRTYGITDITLQRGRNGGWGDPHRRIISLGVYGRQRHILLHELAHIIANDDRRTAWHGWEFCSVYLNLVHIFLDRGGYDSGSHDRLVAEFRRRNVKFSKPRARRQMTEEQREAAVARLAAARAARQPAEPKPEVLSDRMKAALNSLSSGQRKVSVRREQTSEWMALVRRGLASVEEHTNGPRWPRTFTITDSGWTTWAEIYPAAAARAVAAGVLDLEMVS